MYKNTLKKKGHWSLLILLLSVAFCFSCKDDIDSTEKYDPAKPVTFEKFSPEEGGSTTQLIITGTNFGSDTTLVKVKVGNRYAKVVGVSPTKIYAVVKARSVDETSETNISVTVADNETYTFEKKFAYELTQMVSTLAGTGEGGQEDGDASKATFWSPNWLMLDNDGSLFILEENDGFRKMDKGGMVTSLYADPNFRQRAIALSLSQDTMFMARDDWGMDQPSVYFTTRDTGFGQLRSFQRGVTNTCNGVSVNPVDGFLFWNQYRDGTIWYCPTNTPKEYKKVTGIHEDSDFEVHTCWSKDGKTFFRIIRNKHIIYKRKYDPTTHQFIGDEEVLAGKFDNPGFVVGVGGEARMDQPCQGVTDDDGNLFVADRWNNVIRKITPDGYATVYAGNHQEGLVNGLPLKSSFRHPEGIAIDPEGVIYVADRDNRVIRKIVVE